MLLCGMVARGLIGAEYYFFVFMAFFKTWQASRGVECAT